MKKFSIILGSIGLLSLLFGISWVIYGKIEVTLNGNAKVYTTVLEEYHDEGFTITKNDFILTPDKYEYEKKSDIDINKLGEYTISYDVTYKGREFHVERMVEVIDDVKPLIEVDHEVITRDYCSKKDLEELQFTVIDNYDGDITEEAFKEEIDDNYIIKVQDKSGNESSLQVPIKYTEKPSNIFKLNGNSNYYVPKGTNYNDSGVTYTDGCGNKLDDVTITGSVNINETGDYKITYQADGLTLTRNVHVYNPNVGNNISSSEKIIYLTFDDGPGVYTSKVLDILDKYNVKATFFVTHQFGGYVPLLQREYESGHSVAVHTYTHNWDVYSSVDAYVNDFNKMNADIERYTGQKSNIFRFPGGSSNTISMGYSYGVVSAIASYMTSNGYVYFDWDVDSHDASGASSSQIYNNVVNGVSWCSKCVVLMHDIKPNTVNILDSILSTLTSNGYKFGTLSIYSPTVHHSIAN